MPPLSSQHAAVNRPKMRHLSRKVPSIAGPGSSLGNPRVTGALLRDREGGSPPVSPSRRQKVARLEGRLYERDRAGIQVTQTCNCFLSTKLLSSLSLSTLLVHHPAKLQACQRSHQAHLKLLNRPMTWSCSPGTLYFHTSIFKPLVQLQLQFLLPLSNHQLPLQNFPTNISNLQ